MNTTFIKTKEYLLNKEDIQWIIRECKQLEDERREEVYFDTFNLFQEKKTVVVFFSGEAPTKEKLKAFHLKEKNKSNHVFKIESEFGDYYSEKRAFQKGEKNGILVKKSVELYEGEENIFYVAQMYYKGNHITIGIGDTMEQVEKEVQEFLESVTFIVQVEKVSKE